MNHCQPITRTVACLALLGLSLPGFAQDSLQEAQTRLRIANTAYEEKNYSDYVAHLQEALALNPASLRTRYNLACGYALLGDRVRALDLLEELVDLGVDYGMAVDPDLVRLRGEPEFAALLSRLEQATRPVSTSRTVATIDELGLIPEGIAHDPATGRTFFGSMRTGVVYVIDAAGRLSRFASIDVPGFSAIGLTIDPRRNLLWTIGTATELALPHANAEIGMEIGTPTEIPPAATPAATQPGGQTGTATKSVATKSVAEADQTGTATKSVAEAEPPAAPKTGVFSFDLTTGKASGRYFAAPSIDGFNDVTVAPDGDVYLSGSRLAILPADAGPVRPLATSPALAGTNGIVISPGGTTLFTSVYPVGIATVDLASGSARLLETPDGTTLYGIDGLYLHDGDLIAIQNGVEPWRLIRIELNAAKSAVTEVHVLERANPDVVATTGAIIRNEIHYIGQGPVLDPVPSHVPEPLVPFFGKTLIMAAPLDRAPHAGTTTR